MLDKHNPYVWYFMPRGTTFGRSGVPDFICCVSGKLLAIEAKAGKNKTSPLQELEIAGIRQANGHALVVYDTDDDIRKLEALLAVML